MPETIAQLRKPKGLESERVKPLCSCYWELAHFLNRSVFFN